MTNLENMHNIDLFINQLNNLLNLDIKKINLINKYKFDLIAGDLKNSIILAGAGELGQYTLKGLSKIGIKPLVFTDNNKNLWKTKINGIDIVSPKEAANCFKESAVFVITVYNGSSVRQQMLDLGCKYVAPFTYLYLKYEEIFLPFFSLDLADIILWEANEILEVMELWSDNHSRIEYINQIQWRVLRDLAAILNKSPMNELYFPSDLWYPNDQEVFVDCGAYRGDTIKDFLSKNDSTFLKIMAIEPDPGNYYDLTKFISTLPIEVKERIITCQIAISDKSGEIGFNAGGTVGSFVNPESDTKVKCLTLDSICAGIEPTFIKMDVEGAELNILSGAEDLVRKAGTLWAICLYHRQTDLWRIPLFFSKISDNYLFYLRRYAEESWELILYAVPKNRFYYK